MRRRLVSSDEAVQAKMQHTQPCGDCPMARASLPGWLGGATAEEYVRLAHSDHLVDCHALKSTQCAGMAIYRRNVCKRVDEPGLRLLADRELVFATPMEFVRHHEEIASRAAMVQVARGGGSTGACASGTTND
jgi:hypothetical protein